jgi:hypothetical protein
MFTTVRFCSRYLSGMIDPFRRAAFFAKWPPPICYCPALVLTLACRPPLRI